jgi:hypothetical protein
MEILILINLHIWSTRNLYRHMFNELSLLEVQSTLPWLRSLQSLPWPLELSSNDLMR